jgi:hypothetical protein
MSPSQGITKFIFANVKRTGQKANYRNLNVFREPGSTYLLIKGTTEYIKNICCWESLSQAGHQLNLHHQCNPHVWKYDHMNKETMPSDMLWAWAYMRWSTAWTSYTHCNTPLGKTHCSCIRFPAICSIDSRNWAKTIFLKTMKMYFAITSWTRKKCYQLLCGFTDILFDVSLHSGTIVTCPHTAGGIKINLTKVG